MNEGQGPKIFDEEKQHIVLMPLTRWHDLTAEQSTDGICTFPQDFPKFPRILK